MPNPPSASELIAVLLSREVREGELSACGALSMIPAAGLLLAQATHAPKAELLMLGTPLMPFATSRQFHFLAMRGDLGLFFVSGVQIDRRGNYNLHMLGEDQDKPRVRFPGGYGGGMIYYAARRPGGYVTEPRRRALAAQNAHPRPWRLGRDRKPDHRRACAPPGDDEHPRSRRPRARSEVEPRRCGRGCPANSPVARASNPPLMQEHAGSMKT